MLCWKLNPANPSRNRKKVCAVSYLNSVPLIWGMAHGPQRPLFDTRFAIPSDCAAMLAEGSVDAGLVPAIELDRQPLEIIPGCGVACKGPVRSILLVARKPWREIRSLAADASSRTSVALARIILAEKYGVTPQFSSQPPQLEAMLATADAALVIGDPALLVDPASAPGEVLDLGAEWVRLTGLPMVFAVWAGREGTVEDWMEQAFRGSYEYGRQRMEEILDQEAPKRGVSRQLAREYLTRHIAFELGPKEYEGLQLFREQARPFERAAQDVPCATTQESSVI
jgi:chorismate dehydratase